jgi:hypothetical protein
MRAVGLFADATYYPALIAVINSLRYFKVQARVKVYDYRGLPHMLKTYLANYVDVMPIPDPVLQQAASNRGYYYRPIVLHALGIDEYEILLDIDTVVLSDLEDIYRALEQGHVVVVREWEYADAEQRLTHKDLPPESIYHRLLVYPDLYKEPMAIYNGGLLGLSQRQHRFLLDLWYQSTQYDHELAGTFFYLDQHNLSLILASLAKEKKIQLHELAPEIWMQTWSAHRLPHKFLGFEDGQVVLYNGTTQHKMQFYHYTGDIVAPHDQAEPAEPVPVRWQYLLSDLGLPPGWTQPALVEAWHHIWRVRHATPAGELPMFFYQHGPLRAPRCMDLAWRQHLARLLRAVLGNPTIHHQARETWALAFAYDYIEYCGYRGGHLGWLAQPLAMLLDPEVLHTGDRTVSWEGSGDVVLGFETPHQDQRAWLSATRNHQPPYAEHHQGVFLSMGCGQRSHAEDPELVSNALSENGL